MDESMDTQAMKRCTVHFAGRVQGVGFRFTVVEVAGAYDVAGYVQNLANGQVRLVAEGEAPQLDRFIAAVRQRMSRYIERAEVDEAPATGEFGEPADDHSFGIRH